MDIKVRQLYDLYRVHKLIKQDFFRIKVELERSLNRIKKFEEENPDILLLEEKNDKKDD